MNARTEQIIRAVYECCYLSTSDIWRIFYPQARIQASSRKVKRLTEHTYLERVYNPKKKEWKRGRLKKSCSYVIGKLR